jgi:hypothetical protein
MNSGSVGGIESCLATHSYPNPNASREFTPGTAQLQNLRFRLISAPHKPEAQAKERLDLHTSLKRKRRNASRSTQA